MTRKKCKPCVQISVVYKLAIKHWKAFIADVKSNAYVAEMACQINPLAGLKSWDPTHKSVQKVRDLAQACHAKQIANMGPVLNPPEAVEQMVKHYMTWSDYKSWRDDAK